VAKSVDNCSLIITLLPIIRFILEWITFFVYALIAHPPCFKQLGVKLPMGRNKLTALVGLVFAAFLQGCVTCQFPLLDKKTLVTDNSLTGHYRLQDSSSSPANEFDVFLKGDNYLIVHDTKLAYVATLHTWQHDTLLAQLRTPAESSATKSFTASPYFYMLVKRTGQTLALNLIECESDSDCNVTNLDQLSKLALAAEEHPRDRQLATATKTAELGQ
jgi:hypothetical protein